LRFPDFLRTAVLLFGGAATALAVVSIAGAHAKDDVPLLYIAVAWWIAAAIVGLWLGRRREVVEGWARLLADARSSPTLPELRPGTVILNRLWALFVFTLLTGAVAFLLPQIPAIASGFLIAVGLAWRKQSAAVEAIEGRDGVRFYVESDGPLKPIRLVRTPGFRRVEPA
jgi:predicted membrane-bound dolichyl-phosphate-mannose-protein mannosyltransferase